MLSRADLAAGARELDASIDSGSALEAVLTRFELDPQGTLYVAEQRALRMALVMEGWSPAEISALASRAETRGIKLSPEVQALMPSFAALVLDGMAVALAAQSLNADHP